MYPGGPSYSHITGDWEEPNLVFPFHSLAFCFGYNVMFQRYIIRGMEMVGLDKGILVQEYGGVTKKRIA